MPIWPAAPPGQQANPTSAMDLKFLQFVRTHVKELQIQKPH
jgi:hypothetical protein